jgi:hypothetical protein
MSSMFSLALWSFAVGQYDYYSGKEDQPPLTANFEAYHRGQSAAKANRYYYKGMRRATSYRFPQF